MAIDIMRVRGAPEALRLGRIDQCLADCCNSGRIAGRPFAAIYSANAPVACGVAMLVPLMVP